MKPGRRSESPSPWRKRTAGHIKSGCNLIASSNWKNGPGENRYQRHFKASSASALLNGMAVLIRDYAETLNLSVVEVLSVLAVVLTMPTIQEKNRESEDQ